MSSAETDTIVALATPPGRSGIGIVRLSGPQSLGILRQLLRSETFAPQPNMLTLHSIFDPEKGDVLDQAMVCYFKAPHSFTGEDVVELHCHGSPILLRGIVDAALKLNARMADPGEFSLRAVSHGRMNLSEAEAIRDLIEAHTDAGLKQATRQLKGEVSNILQPLKDDLLKVIVRLESSLEFVEDDLPSVEAKEILASLRCVRLECDRLAATFSRGRLLRDGLRVTLLGRPNTGKSSIFNRLLGHGRSIVTDIPGTTRDTITESIGIEGIPIVLTDTAGVRTATDQIESIGVDRTKREAADSDLVILVIDGSEELRTEDQAAMSEVAKARYVIALNKSDVPTFSITRSESLSINGNSPAVIAVSAKTGDGIDTLRTAIIQPYVNGRATGDGLLIMNARHHDLLVRASDAVQQSEDSLDARASEEIVLVGLHNALRYLGDITGETTSDEILGRIFSTFCIGK
ncbi:MAG TPA: tRNA uridine-5-carboxymethylaminomethyl(34) synthesis GTPase MnmE [Pyrinomonadaceae bacterium]|jgi:tRNA modification GTPase|nr:tRNA uridine-5-carboxymethylaminomethyl(34) synthesis GTPase MnmE [Pyrinomonadaceae bacterium]